MKRSIFIIITLISMTIISCSEYKQTKAEYSGKDISEKVSILRDKTTKQASLRIEADGEWTLYAGFSVDEIDFSKPIATGIEKGTFPLSVNDSTRSYFQLVTTDGKAILAESHLPMTGGYNFRDMGGIKTKEGKYVKWGKVLRSDDLHNLTKSDLDYLSSIPLTSIVDFRSQSEMNQAPDTKPSSVKERYELSISPGNLMDIVQSDPKSVRMDSLMMDLNKLLVSDSSSIIQYKRFFKLLQNEKNIPLMFHCSAGKDRTGMAAALFLTSLGVEEDVILKDYLASNTYLGDKYSSLISEHPELKPLMEVRPEYIKAGLKEIKDKYGSTEKYLTDILGVNINRMKELYLY